MIKKLTALLLFSFFVSCAAQPWIPNDIEIGPKVTLPNQLVLHDFKLKNQLRVLIIPNDTAPVFTFQLWVRVGSMDEVLEPKLKRAGLAHFFEHMMFRGTKKYPATAYSDTITRAGGIGLNATTSYDRTNYYVSLPKDKLELILKIESDRFKNLIINKDAFEKERGAVLGELKLSLDNPRSVSYYTLAKLIYKKHPYAKKIIGQKKDIENFTIEEALYFFRKYYAPNNYTIILSGDIKVNHALRLIKEYFGDMQPTKIPSYKIPEQPQQKKTISKTIEHHNAKTRTLHIGYRGVIGDSIDAAPLLLVSAILGDGKGAILKKKLVDTGLASSVHVYSGANRTAGSFAVKIGLTSKASKNRVVQIVNKSIRRLQQGKITLKELERAKNWTLLSIYQEIGSNSGLANFLGNAMTTSRSNNYMRIFEWLEQIKKASIQDVSRVSSYYLKNRKANVLLTKPMRKRQK